MRLPMVIMTVARLCMPTDAHVAAGWNVRAAQERVRLELCLESLCYRMQSLSTWDKRLKSQLDFWYVMKFIIDMTKIWYIRKIRPEEQANSSSQATPNNTTGQTISDLSDQGSAAWSPPPLHPQSRGQPIFSGIHHLGNVNMDIDMGVLDDNWGPFDFMKNTDFDMEQFFDMGIWGDQSYESMGFGGSGMM
jgi:hypothetical protein